MSKFKLEPAVIISAVSALIALAVAFGVDLTADQTKALMAVVVILAGLVTRQQVTPAAKAEAEKLQAYVDVQVEGHPGNPLGN